MRVEIENEIDLSEAGFISSAVEAALRAAGADESAGVFVLLTDDAGIREINHTQRGVDAPTDVLSFPASVPGWADIDPQSGALYMGDIVISIERAKAQANEFGHSLQREAAYLAAHGALHLMGHDHEGEDERAAMRMLEEEAMAAMGLLRDA